MSYLEPTTSHKPKWQQLEELNGNQVTRMAIDLIEGKQGRSYYTAVSELFRRSPAYRELLTPEIRKQIEELLEQDNK